MKEKRYDVRWNIKNRESVRSLISKSNGMIVDLSINYFSWVNVRNEQEERIFNELIAKGYFSIVRQL